MASVEKDFQVKKGLIVGSGDIATTSTTSNLVNTVASTVNFAGAATSLTIGATTGTTTIRNAVSAAGSLSVAGNLVVNTNRFTVDSATGNTSVAGTLSVTGATSLSSLSTTGNASIGGTANVVGNFSVNTSRFTVNATTGDSVISGDLAVNGGELTTTATTATLFNTTATTLSIGQAATSISIGATTGTATIRNATVAVSSALTVGTTLSVSGNSTLAGDLAVNGGDITTTATTFNLLNANATTVNAFQAATTLSIGATTGTTTIRNAASVTGNASVGGTLSVTGNSTLAGDIAVNGGDITTTATTATVFNSTATTVNIAGAGTSVSIGAGTGSTTVNNNLTVAGNLVVNGTTTTVNSTVTTLDDPVLTLGGDTAPASDDNKDRGVEFRWHNGTTAKVGFFGFDDSTGFWTFIPDATNSAEVFAGATGVLDVSRITGSAATLTTARTISLSGDVTGSVSFDGSQNVTISATIAADSVALGTDTTGNYVATVSAGTSGAQTGTSGLTITGTGEGAAVTIAHADTSNVTDLAGATNTFITAQTYDTYGHVLTRTTGSVDFTVAANHAFQNIAVAGQTTVSADSNTDTLTLVAGQGIQITTDAANDTITITNNGALVETTTNNISTAAGTPSVIHTSSATAFRSSRYMVQASHATAGFQTVDVAVVHNGTDVHSVEYANIFTGAASLITITADIAGGNIELRAFATNTNTNVKVVAIQITA